jgi:hypothetical protein
MLAAFQADDLSQREIAVQLNDLKISAPNGGIGHCFQVQRAIKRIEAHAT